MFDFSVSGEIDWYENLKIVSHEAGNNMDEDTESNTFVRVEGVILRSGEMNA